MKYNEKSFFINYVWFKYTSKCGLILRRIVCTGTPHRDISHTPRSSDFSAELTKQRRSLSSSSRPDQRWSTLQTYCKTIHYNP